METAYKVPVSGVVDTPIAQTWRDESGIVWIRLREIGKHGLPEARDVGQSHVQLTAPRKGPVIGDMRWIATGADREAREHYVSDESAAHKTAMAMIVGSKLQMLLGNFFMRVNKPPYPTRIFTDEGAAVAWVLQYPEKPSIG